MTLAIDALYHAKALLLQSLTLDDVALSSPHADPARWWAWPAGLLTSIVFTVGVTLLAMYAPPVLALQPLVNGRTKRLACLPTHNVLTAMTNDSFCVTCFMAY